MRDPVCFALDPIKSRSRSGAKFNRHCLLPVGHDGFHQSRDVDGEVVHQWSWVREDDQPVLLVQDRLF